MGCQMAPKKSPKVRALEDLLSSPSHPLSPRPPNRDDSAEVDVYNPGKNEWDKIPSMNQVSACIGSTGRPEAQSVLGKSSLEAARAKALGHGEPGS